MLRRNWLLLAALVVLAGITVAIGVVTWPLQSALKSYGEADPRNDRYAAGGEQCQPKVLSAIGDRIERAGRATACAKEAEEYRQKTNDLIQQTRAADAAQSQTEIASQQLWTGWLQTLGGFLTLAAAVGAAVYARDAASHTRDANNIAREAQRAWVSLKAAPKLIRPTGVDDLYIRIEFIAENIGATAATDFNFIIDDYKAVELAIGARHRFEPREKTGFELKNHVQRSGAEGYAFGRIEVHSDGDLMFKGTGKLSEPDWHPIFIDYIALAGGPEVPATV